MSHSSHSPFDAPLRCYWATLAGVCAVFCGYPLPAAEQKQSQPDILLIMPDQFRGDCLSILGHPVVRTPNLDALARQGTLFRRAYSTVPSCIPARHAMLTGLHPQTSGVVGYKATEIDVPLMPQLVAAAGYRCMLVGRNMHQAIPDSQYGYEWMAPGSTYVADDDYDTFLQKAAPDSGGIRKLVERLGISNNGWKANPWPLANHLHPTAWIVQQSRKVVANIPTEQPLFLTTSFYAPHPPLFPPRDDFDRLIEKSLPEPAHGDWVDWAALTPEGNRNGSRVLLQGDVLRRAQAGYFGLIEHIDRQIAPLIAEFKARSEKAGRSWLIVFTSDHGEMLGDHGYFRKCEPYEGSANIPLLVAGSAELGFQRGERSTEPVCLEDILPTLLELAGGQRPKQMDGVSLVPVLRGQGPEIRPWLHFEHAACYGPQQAFHALTDGHIKYIWRPTDGGEQLFDLDKDPREERDLSQDASNHQRLATWRGKLIQRLAQRPEGFTDGNRLIPGRPYPPLYARKKL